MFDEFYYRYQEDEYTTVYNELAETVGKSPMVIDQQDVFNIQKGSRTPPITSIRTASTGFSGRSGNVASS